MNAGHRQDAGRDGHADEKLDLVMQPAAVVQDAGDGEQSSTRENGKDFGAKVTADREDDCKKESEVNGQAPKQRDWLQVDFARARMVHHADVKSQATHRPREAKGGQERNRKSNPGAGHDLP